MNKALQTFFNNPPALCHVLKIQKLFQKLRKSIIVVTAL